MALVVCGSSQVRELSALLEGTLHPGQGQSEAVERLRAGETSVGFVRLLLQLLQEPDGAVNAGVQQAGALYFKNFVRRRWPLNPEHGGVPVVDRQAVLDSVVPLALRATRPVRVQVCAAVEEILSVGSFPQNAPGLLPQAVEHLMNSASDDSRAQSGFLELVSSVCKLLRADPPKVIREEEVSYCATTIGRAHLQICRASCDSLLAAQPSVEAWWEHVRMLVNALEIFHDLSSSVVTSFVQDHLDDYFSICLALLGLGEEERLRSEVDLRDLVVQICDVLFLYAGSHKDLFQPYVKHFVSAVGKLLVSTSSRTNGDEMKSSGMRFLSVVATRRWTSAPLDDAATLSAICEGIILPSIALRGEDVEMFWEDPREYLRLELDGGEQECCRRGAVGLVQSLRRFYDAQLTEMLLPCALRLLRQSSICGGRESEMCKDSCVSLIMACAGSALVHEEGCTGVHAKTEMIEEFFIVQVAPELEAEPLAARAVARAASLRFVHAFRSRLSRELLLKILPVVGKHLLSASPVVHTYAALCISSCTTIQDSTDEGRRRRFDAETLKPILPAAVDAMLQIMLSAQGVQANEHLAQALMNIFSFLGDNDMDVALTSLPKLAHLVRLGLEAPGHLEYMHYLFESIAVVVKVVAPTKIELVDDLLLPVIATVVERQLEELLPYSFQLLGLLVDMSSSPSESYFVVLPRLSEEFFWMSQGNVLGLRRLLISYFKKHHIFASTIKDQMEAIFIRICNMLHHQKLELLAFSMFNIVLEHLPCQLYQHCLPVFFGIVLQRLQSGGSPDLEKEFVLSVSFLAHRYPDVRVIPGIFDEVQPGIFEMFMERVWLPNANRFWIAQRKKVCAFGLSKVMLSQEMNSNAQLLLRCCEILAVLLGLSQKSVTSKARNHSTSREDEAYANREFKVGFHRLKHAELPGTELSPVGDLAPEVKGMDAIRAFVKDVLAPLKPRIQQLGDAVSPLIQIL